MAWFNGEEVTEIAGQNLEEYPDEFDITVYAVQPDHNYLWALYNKWGSQGYEVQMFDNADVFFDNIQTEWAGVAFIHSDVKGTSATDILQTLSKFKYPLPCIVMTLNQEQKDAIDALNNGAFRYIDLVADTEGRPRLPYEKQLESFFASALPIAESNANKTNAITKSSSFLKSLTPTELKVLVLDIKGYSRKAAADEHGVSEDTIKTQRRIIHEKYMTPFAVKELSQTYAGDDEADIGAVDAVDCEPKFKEFSKSKKHTWEDLRKDHSEAVSLLFW